VILADQVLELRMRGELLHCLPECKATDAYSRLEDFAKQSPPDNINDDVTPLQGPGETPLHLVGPEGGALAGAPRGSISDAAIEALREKGYEGDLVEAIEKPFFRTFSYDDAR
jgi:hypothetical protein